MFLGNMFQKSSALDFLSKYRLLTTAELRDNCKIYKYLKCIWVYGHTQIMLHVSLDKQNYKDVFLIDDSVRKIVVK